MPRARAAPPAPAGKSAAAPARSARRSPAESAGRNGKRGQDEDSEAGRGPHSRGDHRAVAAAPMPPTAHFERVADGVATRSLRLHTTRTPTLTVGTPSRSSCSAEPDQGQHVGDAVTIAIRELAAQVLAFRQLPVAMIQPAADDCLEAAALVSRPGRILTQASIYETDRPWLARRRRDTRTRGESEGCAGALSGMRMSPLRRSNAPRESSRPPHDRTRARARMPSPAILVTVLLHSLNGLEWNPTADCQAILRERIDWRRRQLSRRAIRRADPDPRLAERPEDRRHTKLRERLGAVRQICPPLIWSPRPPPVLRDRISRHRHGCSRINPKRPCHTPVVAIERGKRHEQPVAAKDGERAAPVVIAGLFRGCLPALPAHGDDVQRKHQTGGDERQGR